MEIEKLKTLIKTLEEEKSLLEAALPPHGLKPGHLQRIEELEDRIEVLKAEATRQTNGGA